MGGGQAPNAGAEANNDICPFPPNGLKSLLAVVTGGEVLPSAIFTDFEKDAGLD
jgi:hypothetical protein